MTDSGSRRAVYLHVGSPVNDAGYLHDLIARNQDRLAGAGVHYTGKGLPAELPAQPGIAVVFDDGLAGATTQEAEHVVHSLGAAEVHVLVTAGDLTSLLPAMWQEHLKDRCTTRWADYAAAVRRSLTGAGEAGDLPAVSPLPQDPAEVLGRWAAAVPRGHLHLVTVPPPGAPADELWRRFTGLLGVDAGGSDTGPRQRGLGVAEAELLRRLNERLDPGVPPPAYRELVRRQLVEGALAAQGRSEPMLPGPDDWAWMAEWSQGLVERVEAAGYDVVGDLCELLPGPVGQQSQPRTPEELTDTDLAGSAVPALVRFVARPPERAAGPPATAAAAAPPAAPRRPLARRLPGAVRRRVRGRLHRLGAVRAHRQSLRAARSRTAEPVAYVHIGLPKTGTTYLQALLSANRDRLGRAGVRYPTDRFDAHFFAALDLMGRGFRGHRYEGLEGAWERVAGQVRDWPGVAVISHEILVRAKAEHVRRLVESLAPARVEVILTVRDLARQLPAVWQEQLKLGHDYTWAEYTAAVQGADPAGRSAGPAADAEDLDAEEPLRAGGSADRAAALRRFGRRFWRARDAAVVAARWAEVIPPERIHVVTVPPPGAGQDLLWGRFAAVIGVPAGDFPPPPRRVNTSLGPAEAELLRRLNPGLIEQLSWEDYERLAKWELAEQVLAARPAITRMGLPAGQWSWVGQHSQRIVDGLAAAGYHVSGSLADLLPSPPEPADRVRRPDETDDAEVLDAALDALAGLVRLRAGRTVG